MMSSLATVEGALGSRLADALEKKRAAIHAQTESRKAELDARVAGASVGVPNAPRTRARSRAQHHLNPPTPTTQATLHNYSAVAPISSGGGGGGGGGLTTASSTGMVGLMTLDQLRKAREGAAVAAAAVPAPPPTTTDGSAGGERDDCGDALARAASVQAGVGSKRKAPKLLSFADEDEDEDGDEGVVAVGSGSAGRTARAAAGVGALAAGGESAVDGKRRRVMAKDPTVVTDFLPDAEREAREAALKAQLAEEWKAEQERVKGEKIEVTYSWWDGSGHRRSIVVPKGTSVGKFLEWVRQALLADFPAMRSLSAER